MSAVVRQFTKKRYCATLKSIFIVRKKLNSKNHLLTFKLSVNFTFLIFMKFCDIFLCKYNFLIKRLT